MPGRLLETGGIGMPHQAVYKSTAAEFLDEFLSGASEVLDATFGYALGLLISDTPEQLSQTTQALVHDNKLPARSTQDFEAYSLSDTSQLAGKDARRPAPIRRIGRKLS